MGRKGSRTSLLLRDARWIWGKREACILREVGAPSPARWSFVRVCVPLRQEMRPVALNQLTGFPTTGGAGVRVAKERWGENEKKQWRLTMMGKPFLRTRAVKKAKGVEGFYTRGERMREWGLQVGEGSSRD